MSQKEWLAHLEWRSALLIIAGARVGYQWWSHVVVAGLLDSQMIVQGPKQPLSRLFDGYFQISLPKEIILPLLLPVNESCNSNLQIQVERQVKTSWQCNCFI